MLKTNKNVQTLSDYMRYEKISSFTIPQISFLEKTDNIVFLDEVVYAKYHDLLMANSIIVDLSIEEYNKFRLNSKLLSQYLYNTPNLYHIILYMNNTNEFEFDTKRVRLLTIDFINSILKRILVHEEKNIEKSKILANKT